MTVSKVTRYRIEWQLPHGRKLYHVAELYDSMTEATIAAERAREYFNTYRAPVALRFIPNPAAIDYRIAPVAVRRTVHAQ